MQYIIISFLLLSNLFLSSCIERVKHEGVVIEQDSIDKIIIGKSTKEELNDLLGTPSFIMDNLENMPETWEYISTDKKWYAFLKPTITSHLVLEIEFKGNVVSRLNKITKEQLPTEKMELFKITPKDNLKNYPKPILKSEDQQ
jgi:outer membrane protein assembly factor BamE (lipoprotein component of BamABCDE complex)